MKNLHKLLLVVPAILLLLGLFTVLKLRFDRSDHYPAYSSFNTSPKGTRALFESLEKLQEIETTRNLERDWIRNSKYQEASILLIGLSYHQLSSEQNLNVSVPRLKANHGSRLIFALDPESAPGYKYSSRKKAKEQDENKNTDVQDDETAAEKTDDETDDQREENQSDWTLEHLPKTDALIATALPPEINAVSTVWKGQFYFKDYGAGWEPLLEIDGHCVAMRRATYGDGEIILLTDSYLFSNEAMFGDRQIDLLQYLFKDKFGVVFEETHLGVSEKENVMKLLLKYRLHGFFAGLVLLAILFLWQQCQLPPKRASEQTPAPPESDRTESLAHLLQTHIPPDQLLKEGIAQWKAGMPKHHRFPKQVEYIEREASERLAAKTDPVTLYRLLQKLWSERKKT